MASRAWTGTAKSVFRSENRITNLYRLAIIDFWDDLVPVSGRRRVRRWLSRLTNGEAFHGIVLRNLFIWMSSMGDLGEHVV